MNAQNEIKLTKELTDWAADPMHAALIKHIEDDEEYLPIVTAPNSSYFDAEQQNMVSEFLTSESYRVLSEEEKSLANRAIRVFSETNEPRWAIEGDTSQDNLLGNRSILREIPAPSGDLLLASGMALLDIDRVDPNFWSDHCNLANKRISFANMIGVAIATKALQYAPNTPLNTISFASAPFIQTEVTVGGDMHGDFRIQQVESYPEGSIDPVGARVPYAPYGSPRFASAYHSSELEVLECLLKHLNVTGLNNDEQRDIINTAIHTFIDTEEVDNSPFNGFYADYGEEGALEFFCERMKCYFMSKDSRVGTDEVSWSELMVAPQSNRRLQVKSSKNQFLLQNVYLGDGKEVTKSSLPVVVPTDQLGPFMQALLYQAARGSGRTAPTSLLKLLSARLSY